MPSADTFEKTFNGIPGNEIKELVLSYLKNNNSLKELLNIPFFKLNIKQKLLKAITDDRKDYVFGNNPVADFDNFEEFFSGFKKIDFEKKIDLMTTLANKKNGKYVDFWRSNPEILIAYANSNAYLPYQIKTLAQKLGIL